jgi:putative transposase
MMDTIRQATGHPIRAICAVLEVPRSSYYHAAKPTLTQRSDEETGAVIETIFREHRRRYGYRRISAEMASMSLTCAPQRVRRLMRERGLKALQPRSFVPKTSDGRADRPSPNLLPGQPLPTTPDTVWAGDITYIPVGKGWLYLAVVIDLNSRKIVGWALADHLRAGLAAGALRQALQSRRPARGLIFHSDRGSQYGSREYRSLLARHGLRQSMSARANPYHNAWTESFMGTLKKEMLQGGCFINAADARTEIFAYIEAYYNTRRRHSSLAYLTPVQFEAGKTSLN